jgi:hypothetical protein
LKGVAADGAIHRCAVNSILCIRGLEHDPEKWEPVFRKDHAQTKRGEIMIGFNLIEP